MPESAARIKPHRSRVCVSRVCAFQPPRRCIRPSKRSHKPTYPSTRTRNWHCMRTVSQKPDESHHLLYPYELTPPRYREGGLTRSSNDLSTTVSPCSSIPAPIGSEFNEQRSGFVEASHASFSNCWTTSFQASLLQGGVVVCYYNKGHPAAAWPTD